MAENMYSTAFKSATNKKTTQEKLIFLWEIKIQMETHISLNSIKNLSSMK